MKRAVLTLIIACIIIGCKQKGITTSFNVGMDEKEWRDSINVMLKRGALSYSSNNDSTSFIYSFNLLDTIVNCDLSLNGDGIPKGSLRVISLNFGNIYSNVNIDTNALAPNYPTLSEERTIYESFGNDMFTGRNSSGRISWYSGNLTSAKVSDRILRLLSERYGSPDSISDYKSHRIDTVNLKTSNRIKKNSNHSDKIAETYSANIEDNLIDTSEFKYYFHNSNSTIIFSKGEIHKANYFIPFNYSTACYIEQFINDYDNKLESIKSEVLRNLTPKDVITISLDYELKVTHSEFGTEEATLILSSNLSPLLRKTVVEEREIKSLKGIIEIRDEYGSLIHSIENINIDANGSLPANGKAGKGRLMSVYNPSNYRIGLNLFHKSIPDELRQALKSKRRLKIEFIPSAIRFTDDSILK